MKKTNIVLYDGFCNLCNGWAQFIIKRDTSSTFQYFPLQSNVSKELLGNLKLSEKLDTIVYIKDDKYFTESTAIIEILKDLGGCWKAFSIFKVIPQYLRDKIYRWIASNRYKYFGKRKQCDITITKFEKR